MQEFERERRPSMRGPSALQRCRCASSGVYVPRDTHRCDAAVLVREHLAGFLERVEEGAGGCGENGMMRARR